MKIFVLLTVIALLGGSDAFLEGLASVVKNLGSELSSIGKSILQVAEPVANSVLQTLEKAGTQLLTASASELLSHFGAGSSSTTSKRDLSDAIKKIGQFVDEGEKLIKEKASIMDGAFKYTLSRIQEEIQHVLSEAKPLSGLIDEVKGVVTNHNNFIEDLLSKVKAEGETIVNKIFHHGENKRGLVDSIFGDSLKHLFDEATVPIKDALSGIIKDVEGKVMTLFG